MDEYKKILKRFRNLKYMAMLKAFLVGLIIMYAFFTISSIIAFLTSSNKIFVIYIFSSFVLILSSALLYLFKYRIKEEDIARKLDSLGLNEKVVTMLQEKNNDSYIAKIQREDALNCLKAINEKSIKYQIQTLVYVLSALAVVSVCALSSVQALQKDGTIPSFKKIISANDIYEIEYIADEGGQVNGDIYQKIINGGDSSYVIATPDEGYIFDKWSDGVLLPARQDRKITRSFAVTARFTKISDYEHKDEREDEKGGNDFKFDKNVTKMPGHGAAGQYIENSQVLDGKTYYKDVYEEYRKKVNDLLSQGIITEEEWRKAVEVYFETIKV